MRSATSFLSGLAAAVLVVVLLPLAWIATHVASEDGYVGFTASMVDDPSFRGDLAGAAAEEVVTRAGLPSAAVEPVRAALTSAAERVVDGDDFADAWEQTQRRSHQAVFADQRELPAELDASDRLVVDVAPIAQALVDAVSDRLPVSVEVPGQMLVTVGGSDQRQLVDRIRSTPELAVLVALVTAGLGLLAVAAARRRGVAIGWLGLGVAAAALAARLLSHAVVPRVVERSDAPSDLARAVQRLIADRALDSFDQWTLVTMVGAAVVAAAGFVVRRSSP